MEGINMPVMIMLVGLPGSGKTTLAHQISIGADGGIFTSEEVATPPTSKPVIHSSDALRLEMFGDSMDNRHNNELFAELHRRIKRDLMDGRHIIYDATNINKKQRRAFLDEIGGIVCEKVCVCVMTSFEDCLKNNAKRERTVPEKAIRRMFMNWQPPHYHEGFNAIYMFFSDQTYVRNGNRNLIALYDQMKNFDQGNKHHSMTLGEHCIETQKYCYNRQPDNRALHAAAFLHDVGKLYTQTRTNAKGEEDGDCHYYQHQCVGAYVALFYLCGLCYSIEEIVDADNMIYYHMHPFMAWKQSEKALEKDKRMIGEDLYRNIILLHEADVAAH